MAAGEFSVPSTRGDTNLYGYSWIPEDGIRANVLIVHGMLEYGGRYADTAEYLNEKGVAVYAYDHLGHGRTSPTDPGFFALESGDEFLVNDAIEVARHVVANSAGAPVYIVGHSMGSYIVRLMITKYSEGIDGVALVGTGSRSKEEATMMVAFAQKSVDARGAKEHDGALDEAVLGKGFSRVKIGAADLSQLPLEKRNRLRFTCSGYRDIFRLTERLASEEDFGNIRKDLKISFHSGSLDRVGNLGEGVRNAATDLEKYGLRPTVKIYEGMNHDILHEDGWHQVCDDILTNLS